MDTGIITYTGDAIKVAEDGTVSGYLVLFSTEADPDLSGEYFTAETDFGVDFDDGPVKTAIHYQHGADEKIGKKRIGEGVLKKDQVGIWIDGQVKKRNEYLTGVHDLAKKGKLGWSSGTAKHLVEYEDQGAAKWIKTWPLGLDASLTPTPCEPRTQAISLKSLMEETEGRTFADEINATIVAVKACVTRIEEYAAMKAKDDRRINPDRRRDFQALKDSLDAVIKSAAPKPDPEIEVLKMARLREKNRRTHTK